MWDRIVRLENARLKNTEENRNKAAGVENVGPNRKNKNRVSTTKLYRKMTSKQCRFFTSLFFAMYIDSMISDIAPTYQDSRQTKREWQILKSIYM